MLYKNNIFNLTQDNTVIMIIWNSSLNNAYNWPFFVKYFFSSSNIFFYVILIFQILFLRGLKHSIQKQAIYVLFSIFMWYFDFNEKQENIPEIDSIFPDSNNFFFNFYFFLMSILCHYLSFNLFENLLFF